MPKQVGKGRQREKIKIIFPFRSFPTHNRKYQKNRKKIKKIKNTIITSFEAEIGWKRMRERENKNYRSVSFRSYPTHNRKFQKNSSKIRKSNKYPYGFISTQYRLEKAEKERK